MKGVMRRLYARCLPASTPIVGKKTHVYCVSVDWPDFPHGRWSVPLWEEEGLRTGMFRGGYVEDEAKLHEFMGKLVADMGGAAMIANVILGEELGLYRAMADSTPMTPEALAAKTGCNPRLIREWLHAQAAAGYMEHSEGQFRLPPEQAQALAVEDSPVYVAGGAVVLASLFLDKDKMITAMRSNGALPWGDHHPSMFQGT